MTLILLLVVILTGVAPTFFVNLFGHGYDYRTTVAPWFRGLFVFSPDTNAIAHAPFIYQLHATAAWLIWGLWPFSRLVHAWSYPLWYLWRPYVVFRSRVAGAARASPAPAGASGARSVSRTNGHRHGRCWRAAATPGPDSDGDKGSAPWLLRVRDGHRHHLHRHVPAGTVVAVTGAARQPRRPGSPC